MRAAELGLRYNQVILSLSFFCCMNNESLRILWVCIWQRMRIQTNEYLLKVLFLFQFKSQTSNFIWKGEQIFKPLSIRSNPFFLVQLVISGFYCCYETRQIKNWRFCFNVFEWGRLSNKNTAEISLSIKFLSLWWQNMILQGGNGFIYEKIYQRPTKSVCKWPTEPKFGADIHTFVERRSSLHSKAIWSHPASYYRYNYNKK